MVSQKKIYNDLAYFGKYAVYASTALALMFAAYAIGLDLMVLGASKVALDAALIILGMYVVPALINYYLAMRFKPWRALQGFLLGLGLVQNLL